jgi:predicted O-linked N-acetylglucosamine transferase (SPINDLY family)
VRLPHLGCYYQAAPSPGRAAPPDLGVAPEVPVLICPGTPQKYAPEYDGLLTGIAKRLGRCRLVFFAPRAGQAGTKLRARLEAAFQREGLRLADYAGFVSWLDPAAFHALLRRADLYLDTAGFSGFNSAMQSLECGLPLVTLEGRFLRGRLASGILRRMGMHELVAASPAAYVELAAKIARDKGYQRELRGRIEKQRGVLFEDEAPIRGLEEFLEKAVRA